MKPLHLNPHIVRFAAWPLIAYVRHFPFRRGKGLVLRRMLRPLLATLGEQEFPVPPHGAVWLSASETLGLHWLVYGPFEGAERAYAASVVRRGDWAIDVGANVGVFSVTMGQALAGSAHLIAVEPLEENLRRLRRHLAQSGIDRVHLVASAVGARPGRARLWRTTDTAYASLQLDATDRGIESIEVEVETLDQVWDSHGAPRVGFVKIDVEGAEVEVLRGAACLIATCTPELLIEVDDLARLREVESLLGALGYQRSQQPGFEPWNHLFTVLRPR